VVLLIVFTAVIGMFLAMPGMVALLPLVLSAVATALLPGAAARHQLFARAQDLRSLPWPPT